MTRIWLFQLFQQSSTLLQVSRYRAKLNLLHSVWWIWRLVGNFQCPKTSFAEKIPGGSMVMIVHSKRITAIREDLAMFLQESNGLPVRPFPMPRLTGVQCLQLLWQAHIDCCSDHAWWGLETTWKLFCRTLTHFVPRAWHLHAQQEAPHQLIPSACCRVRWWVDTSQSRAQDEAPATAMKISHSVGTASLETPAALLVLIYKSPRSISSSVSGVCCVTKSGV